LKLFLSSISFLPGGGGAVKEKKAPEEDGK